MLKRNLFRHRTEILYSFWGGTFPSLRLAIPQNFFFYFLFLESRLWVDFIMITWFKISEKKK